MDHSGLAHGVPYHRRPAAELRSGCQLNNVSSDDAFTYYGDGTDIHPDNFADMETFKWLLKNKF